MLSSIRGELRFAALFCALLPAAGSTSSAVEPGYSLAPVEDNVQLGSSFIGLGDIDGDGCVDFAVSDQSFIHGGSLFSSGMVYVISGSDGSLIRSHEGVPAQSQLFGTALAALDANDDGVCDLAVGAPGHVVDGVFGCGAVWVHSGVDGSLLSLVEGEAGSQYGSSLANAGDQDGDGTDDLFVGAPWANGARGEVVVQSGGDGSRSGVVPSGGVTPPEVASSFGASVVNLGDIDGDGRPDLAVGEPGFRGTSYDIGRVSIFLSTGQLPVAEITGVGLFQRMGDYLAAVDDADGDGLPDLMVGSYTGGDCRVVSGLDLSLIADLSMPEIPRYNQVVPGGSIDLDADGVADWLLGTTAASVVDGRTRGGVRVFSGVDSSLLLEIDAIVPASGFGLVQAVIPGLGFVAGEIGLTDPVTGGRGAAYVWFVEQDPDTDGDGVVDSEDENPESIMDPSVLIGGIDSGVENRVDERGRTIADEFAELGEPADARNQGQYVSGFSRLAAELRRAGRISKDEGKALHAAAIRWFVSQRGRK